MGRRKTVIRKTEIAGSVPEVWLHLTRPEKLARWFGDTPRFAPGASTHFDFGDGDFFAVDGIEMHPPTHLRMRWKFMGVGDVYDIQFFIDRRPGVTEVTVLDHGASCDADAESLSAGWKDFLGRLRRVVEEGGRARYGWTESIQMAARLSDAEPSTPWNDPDWWSRQFPTADVRLVATGSGELDFRVRDPNAGGETAGRLRLDRRGDVNYLVVEHDGWDALPPERGFNARRGYAELWSRALLELEKNVPSRITADAS